MGLKAAEWNTRYEILPKPYYHAIVKQPTWSWHQIRQPHIREYEAGESGANFTSVRGLGSWLMFHQVCFYVYTASCPSSFFRRGVCTIQEPLSWFECSYPIYGDLLDKCCNGRQFNYLHRRLIEYGFNLCKWPTSLTEGYAPRDYKYEHTREENCLKISD